VDECDKWALLCGLDAASTSSFNARQGRASRGSPASRYVPHAHPSGPQHAADASRQLDRIGIGRPHTCPTPPPFSMSLPASASASDVLSTPSSPTTPPRARPHHAAATSSSALTAADVFDKLYVDTTTRAIDMYIKGARRKICAAAARPASPRSTCKPPPPRCGGARAC